MEEKNPYFGNDPQDNIGSMFEAWNEGHAVGKVKGFEEAKKEVIKLANKGGGWIHWRDVKALHKPEGGG